MTWILSIAYASLLPQFLMKFKVLYALIGNIMYYITKKNPTEITML